MSTFVLIHGSWHGAWCWKNIVPLLEKEGHRVIIFDLPGHGNDKTPIGEVTFEKYIEKTVQEIDKAGEQVILVGHSMGGSVISQAAELRSQSIKKLIYVAGFLLENGQSVAGYGTPMEFSPNDPFFNAFIYTSDEPGFDMLQPENFNYYATLPWDKQVEYLQNHKVGLNISSDDVRTFICNMAPQKEFDYLVNHLCIQAFASEIVPLKLTKENYGSVPRYYVKTLNDKCIKPEIQNKMLKNMPCEKEIPINADHDAFFSAPEELARILLEQV